MCIRDSCHIDEIPSRGAIRITHGAEKVAVFKSAAEKISALEDKCPHQGGPLSDGIVHGNCVTCPLHNWDIDLSTGLAQGADTGCVKTFDVQVVDRTVFIELQTTAELSEAR